MSDKVVYSAKKGINTSFCNRKRPKISQRRPLNRHELEAPDDLYASTSAKKPKQSEYLYDIEVDPAFGYHIINFIAVFSAISNAVVCKICQSEVKFTESSKRGLGFKLVMSCENCEKTEIPSCPLVEKAYEINRRIIIAMRLLGVGWHGIRQFCAFMELSLSDRVKEARIASRSSRKEMQEQEDNLEGQLYGAVIAD